MIDRQQPMPRPHGWQFIDLAEHGVNTGRSYVAALLCIVLCPLGAAVLLGLAVGVGAALRHTPPGSMAPIAAVMEQYGPIVVAGAAVLYGVVRLHRRPWRSLIAPDLHIDRRRLAIGGGVEFAILVGQLAIVQALTGWSWRLVMPGAAAAAAFALGLVLIPLQAASEEILFRGYLTQALGRAVRSRILIAGIVGLLFGLLHLHAHGPLTVPYFLIVALIFSLVSLRDDRLELAIGGHAAMNLFAFAVANIILIGPGPVDPGVGDPGLSEPGVIGAGQSAMPFNWAAILVLIVNGALFYGVTRLLVRVICDRGAVRR